MDEKVLQEPLISDQADANSERDNFNNGIPTREFRKVSFARYVAAISLLLMVVSWVEIAILLRQINEAERIENAGRSVFSGLKYDTPVEYNVKTAWGDANETVGDQVWNTVDSSPIVVALSDEYASQHGLEKSTRFPWDHTKGIYHIKAFHHLHCLKNMRKAFLDLHFKRKPVVSYEHYLHCLDAIRQDIMCFADDTPMPSIDKKHYIGNGQIMQCRNWDELISWTQEPERQSCFHMIDDFHVVRHTLEEFDSCPENSPYYEKAKKYFEENGHHDPFGD